MDTLCRVCIEKAATCTSLSSKIGDSSSLSFFDFLNKCTTLNAREGDGLPQSVCSVCDNAMKMFYSFMKRAEKSDLILREALKKLAADGRYNGHKESPCEETVKRKISPRKSSTRSPLYILDFVKEEPHLSESKSIVAVKKAVINESEEFESNLNHREKSNEEPDDVLLPGDRRLMSIDTTEFTDSENDIPRSELQRKLAKSEDVADYQRNSYKEITKETIEEESEDFYQGDSFHCHPSKNSTESLPYILDIVKEEPRISESTLIVAVEDAVIKESENLESNLDHSKESIDELDDILSCKDSRPESIETEHTDSEDDVPISFLKKRLAKSRDEADSRNKTIAHGCEICGKKFLKKHNLNSHLKNHKENRLRCKKCDKEFKNIYRLNLHLNSHADPLKPVKCKQCGIKLKHRDSLLRHMQLHTNRKRFKCEHCKKSFVKESSCRDHVCYKRIYDKRNRKKIECEICGKKFSKNYLDNVHMERHKGTKSKCNLCGKEFMHRDSLSRHMKWHNNPKSCKCETCGKLLSSKYNYDRHREIFHPEQSEKSKIDCEICGKSFSSKYILINHMEDHNGIQRKCDKCGKEFKHRDSLSRHMKFHNNPYKCEICGRLFDRKYRYIRHIKNCGNADKQQTKRRSKTKKVVILHESAANIA